jgi:hypothetical protein
MVAMFNTMPMILDVSIHPELESNDDASGWYACSNRIVIWYSELFVRLTYEITPVMSVTDKKRATIIDTSPSPVTNDERDGGNGMLTAGSVLRDPEFLFLAFKTVYCLLFTVYCSLTTSA